MRNDQDPWKKIEELEDLVKALTIRLDALEVPPSFLGKLRKGK